MAKKLKSTSARDLFSEGGAIKLLEFKSKWQYEKTQVQVQEEVLH